jgi:peptidoglycan hydrolase FlgJ
MRSSIDTLNLSAGATGKQPPLSKKDRDLQSLRKSCREFEAIYTQEVYKAMRKTVPEGGLFEKDMASELYKEMMDMEIAKSSASGKGIGIGEAMYQQMKGKIENKK